MVWLFCDVDTASEGFHSEQRVGERGCFKPHCLECSQFITFCFYSLSRFLAFYPSVCFLRSLFLCRSSFPSFSLFSCFSRIFSMVPEACSRSPVQTTLAVWFSSLVIIVSTRWEKMFVALLECFQYSHSLSLFATILIPLSLLSHLLSFIPFTFPLLPLLLCVPPSQRFLTSSSI